MIYELRTQIWDIGEKVGNVINNKKDIVLVNRQMKSVCPIFKVSNKSLEGIQLFKNFLNNLEFPTTTAKEKSAYGGEFHIQKTY